MKTPVYAADRVDKKQLGGVWFRVFGEVFIESWEALEHDLMRLDEDKDANEGEVVGRFIVCASVTNLVSQASAVDVLTRFAEKCVAMSKTKACKNQLNPKAWQPRADFLATVVLSALPWSNGVVRKGKTRLCKECTRSLRGRWRSTWARETRRLISAPGFY